jgi:methylmalonyl-CoA mutase
MFVVFVILSSLLKLCIEAARRRVTLGEMSDAMEESFGRYKANIRTISGIYAMNANKNEFFEKAVALTQKFEDEEGRRPRIMVAKMGQDGHDRGAKVVATAFADMGFDVDVAPLFQTPEEVAKQAVENDIHILGVSSLAAGHKTLVPQVVEELKKLGADDITIVVGGVIPQQDYDFLYQNGADFIFGPGTNLPKSAVEILEKFLK